MATKHRWLRLRLPRKGSGLEPALAELCRDTEGFERLDPQDRYPRYQYTWSQHIPLVKRGEVGGFEEFTVEVSVFVRFLVDESLSHCLIRVDDPPRSIGPLISRLEAHFGVGFAAEKVVATSSVVRQVLAAFDGSKMKSASIPGIRLSQHVMGSLDLTTDTEIELDKLPVPSLPNLELSRGSYRLRLGGIEGDFAFSSQGLFTVRGALAPRILETIHGVLIKYEGSESSQPS